MYAYHQTCYGQGYTVTDFQGYTGHAEKYYPHGWVRLGRRYLVIPGMTWRDSTLSAFRSQSLPFTVTASGVTNPKTAVWPLTRQCIVLYDVRGLKCQAGRHLICLTNEPYRGPHRITSIRKFWPASVDRLNHALVPWRLECDHVV